MEVNGTGTPGSFTLKLIDNFPLAIIQTFSESNQHGPLIEFLTQQANLLHDLATVTGTAHEDHCGVAPIVLF
jgi:hypothetical protein